MADNLKNLQKELPQRRREQSQLVARLRAVRRRIRKVKADISRLTKPKARRRPREAFVSNVVNQSARTDSIRLIVLHDTEGGNVPGVADLRGVDSWFDNPAAQASAHVTVDAEGNSAQHVPNARKAWHCAAFNSQALGCEQVGFTTTKTWPEAQLNKTAAYVAYWSQKYNIPLVHSTSHGVCQHKDLGEAGGNHDDCGPNYPFDRVLAKARALLV